MSKLRAARDIVIVAAGLGVALLVWQSWQADAARGPSAEARADLARTACRTRIGDQLHDPGRAEWNLRSWPVVATDAGALRVEADLRAPNAFGAMVRARFVCEVVVEGTTRRVVRVEAL